MHYFLFFFWLIVLSWCLTKIRFVKNAGLNNKIVIGLFIIKIIIGLINGWLTAGRGNVDTWGYHRDALEEYHLLFTHPKEYFTNLFYTGYSNRYGGFFQTQNSYWNDLKTNLMVKLVSVLHIFSGGNYYVNVVLYNFLIFFGITGLYRVFKEVYNASTWLTVAMVFLLPSVLYYSSILHKDGLTLAAVGIIIFNIYYGLHQDGFSFKRVFFIFFVFLLMFLLRSYMVFALLPALAAMVICYKKRFNILLVFAIVYMASAILFFNLQYIFPSVSLPQYVAQKQADFISLKGNTAIPVNTLKPSFASYAANAPQALQHSLFRPSFADYKLSVLLLPFTLEMVFYFYLILLFFYRPGKETYHKPFVLFSLCFAFCSFLFIGYTVPVLGAIIRYRSVYLPFLLAPFVLHTNWNAIFGPFYKIKK